MLGFMDFTNITMFQLISSVSFPCLFYLDSPPALLLTAGPILQIAALQCAEKQIE